MIKNLDRLSNTKQPQRGFTLLIAIVLASVSLVVGLALADVAYKQVVLSSTAKQSQTAFYKADSALECALYYDQQFAAFNQTSAFESTDLRCENRPIQNYATTTYGGGGLRTTFEVTCPEGGLSAQVTIYKEGTGTCTGTGAKSCLYATGYNLCQSAPNRFERGLKVVY
jgi:Tfp pilus assembly protein PilE